MTLPLTLERFATRLKFPADSACWLWTGARSSSGYGSVRVRRNDPGTAHRWLYEELIGPIPRGMYLLHSCFTPLCVFPAHLRVGTPSENMLDDDVEHTGDADFFACGHPTTAENTTPITGRPRGRCLQCKTVLEKAARQRRASLR